MTPEVEWLETNGTGGFWCGSVSGALHRKWHGFFLAAKPPRDRRRTLSGTVERLVIDGQMRRLTAEPQGDEWLPPEIEPNFEAFPVPHWQWPLPGGGVLHKHLVIPHGTRDVALLLWRVEGAEDIRLTIEFLWNHESLGDAAPTNGAVRWSGGLTASFDEQHRAIGGDPAELRAYLRLDEESEKSWHETLLRGAGVEAELRGGGRFAIAITSDGHKLGDPWALLDAERARRLALPRPRLLPEFAHLEAPLAHAADQFIVDAGAPDLKTIIAGYPWFTDWGRDTMIALPGLCIARGCHQQAHAILTHFLGHLDGGLIPNIFPEADAPPRYNTIDATLWLVEALFRAHRAAGTRPGDSEWERLTQIIAAHLRGTHNDTFVDDDGLLCGGSEGSQLTWMDVKVNGEVPTPRHGKAVEIQGLWHNALRLMAAEAAARGEQERALEWQDLAAKCSTAFAARFVRETEPFLADVVDRDGPGTADWSHRPNALLPFALTHNIIPAAQRAPVLEAARARLVTPRGLRSLSPADAAYRGQYRGLVLERDRAYHQGTVWLWLMASYFAGVRAERGSVPGLFAELPALRSALAAHFTGEACLHQANEIFDGDAPHRPRGCFAQAWSVAAIIECLGTA